MKEQVALGEDAIRDAAAKAEEAAAVENDSLDVKLFGYQRTDYGNAQRLLSRFGKHLMHVRNRGWYAWDGKRWNFEEGEQRVHIFAHKTYLAIYDEAHAFARMSDEEDRKALIREHQKWAKTSGSSQKIKNMLTEVLPYVQRSLNELDAHPYLLNLENCTLDLRDGVKRRRWMPKDLITRMSTIAYNPEASCPNFLRFLERVLPDAAEQVFLQRYLGYALTGDICEQKLILCFGEGRNGKSTLLNAILNVFGQGEYAAMLPFESLLQDKNRRGKDASPDIARLPGARFVAAVEPESGVRLSTSMIKRFTGGEPITVRDNFKGFFDFQPQFKLFMSFNDKPTVSANDEGTWRRMMMLEFKERITDEEVDKHIDAKLAAEAPGILNWLLDGYRDWQEKGLQEPESVLAATTEYREENDHVGRFINESVIKDDGNMLPAKDLMEALKKWCEDNGLRPISQRRLGDKLKKMKFEKDDSGPNHTVVYHHIALASPPPSGGDSGKSGRNSGSWYE